MNIEKLPRAPGEQQSREKLEAAFVPFAEGDTVIFNSGEFGDTPWRLAQFLWYKERPSAQPRMAVYIFNKERSKIFFRFGTLLVHVEDFHTMLPRKVTR